MMLLLYLLNKADLKVERETMERRLKVSSNKKRWKKAKVRQGTNIYIQKFTSE